MINPYDPFRIKSALGMKPTPLVPTQTPTPTFPTQGVGMRGPNLQDGSIVGDEDDDSPGNYISEIMKLSKPGPQMTAYQNMLKEMPNRADYTPTKMNRLAAMFSGFGAGVQNPAQGYATASAITEQPYALAMQDYGSRVGAMRESAALERQASEDRLKAVTGAQAAGLKYKDYLLKVKEAQDKQKLDQSLIDWRKQQGANADRDYNLNVKEHERKVSADLATKQHQNYQDQIASGNLAVRAAAQQSLSNYQGRMAGVGERMAGAAEKRAEKAGQRQATPATPDQQADQLQNQLFLMKTDPAFGSYIKSTKDGVFDIAPNDGTEKWKVFKKELDRRMKKALETHNPMTDPDDKDDDLNPFTIIMPSPSGR